MEVWTQFFGRLHPMVLHLPIGLVLGWVAVELLSFLRRSMWHRRPAGDSAEDVRQARLADESAEDMRPRRPAGESAEGMWHRRPAGDSLLITALAWLAAGSAVLTAATGFVLSYEPGYSGKTLLDHQRFGIAVAVGSVLAAALRHVAARRAAGSAWWHAYAAVLSATAVVLLPAGHLGASMTHGPDFLFEPFAAKQEPRLAPPANTVPRNPRETPTSQASASAASAVSYADIAPIFADRCVACHGPTRQRARLALHEPQAILKGGKSGPVIVPGDSAASELVRRLRLPLDDDAHMPPADEEQPSPEEIERIVAWIAAGAPFEEPQGQVAAGARDGRASGGDVAGSAVEAPDTSRPVEFPQPAPDASQEPSDDARLPAPSAEALAALRGALVHVEALRPGSHALRIDFAAAALQSGDSEVAALLGPLRANVVDLSLARTRIGDDSLPAIARLENLRRLDLRRTRVTDVGVAALRGHARLEELVLAQTQLGDASAEHLLAMPALRRVYVWGTSITAGGVARLHAGNAQLVVDVGAPPDAQPLESEGELTFTGDAPLPGASAQPSGTTVGANAASSSGTTPPPAGDAASATLRPINATCPVTGKPIDPRYAVVHDGRVVGFCCPNCPQQFWSDPARYAPK